MAAGDMHWVERAFGRFFARSGRLLAIASFAFVFGALVSACSDETPQSGGTETPSATAETDPDATADATRPAANTPRVEGVVDFSDVVAEVGGSVVLIESMGVGAGVSGSGVVVDREGHVLTNFHVVQGQQSLKVTLPNGAASLATVVGTDPANDLAVIRTTSFDSSMLQPVTFGNSDEVRVGQPVFAIGSPFDQKFTVTSGIISATNRTSQSAFAQRTIHDVLQTDAALNPGNSGGPLFNLDGEVIGINTSIENPEGRVFAGIGFAVPSNTAQRFLPQMLAGEDIQHPQLGVSTTDLDQVVADQLGIPVAQGVRVDFVTPGSAAERAGIREGDVIVSVNGEVVRRFEDLARAVDIADVGDEVTIIVSRGGQEVALTAQLQPWDLS